MMKENVIIKQECHCRMPLSGIYNACRCHNEKKALLNRGVEDPRLQTSGMTPLWMSGQGLYREEALNKNAFRAPLRSGFTLIELLVVVLIIGILAAVALPQYQVAVAKSRAIEIITHLKALGIAEQAYFLANGEYIDNTSALDVSFQGRDVSSGTESVLLQARTGFSFSRLTNNPPYVYGYPNDNNHADNNHRFFLAYVLTSGEIYCEVHNTAVDLMKKVCKSLGTEAPCPKNNGTPATCYKIS